MRVSPRPASRRAGVPPRSDARTPNTVDCHRLIWFAGKDGRQDALVEALFRAYFMEGRNIGDHAVMAEVAEAAGLDRARVEALLAGSEGNAEVAEELVRGRRLGVNGVPTFVISGVPIMSGAAPPGMLADEIARAAQAAL